jgi:MazG family protein
VSRFNELVEIVRRLRGPDGCPWDREQTPQSLRGCLLEEAYETLDALDRDDPADLRDELGDLLLQIVMQADMAAGAGRFTVEDVITGIIDKMVRRHPHVFGDTAVADATEVLRNWSRIKTAERASKGPAADASILSGLPRELPALHAAHRMGEKAARVGFDWPNAAAAMGKVHEEIAELEEALASGIAERVAHELGDTLFALASVGRLADQNAEVSLREALARFARRFRGVERVLAAAGRDIHTVPQAELEALWDAEKAAERGTDPTTGARPPGAKFD